jgi:hypothetical protein
MYQGEGVTRVTFTHACATSLTSVASPSKRWHQSLQAAPDRQPFLELECLSEQTFPPPEFPIHRKTSHYPQYLQTGLQWVFALWIAITLPYRGRPFENKCLLPQSSQTKNLSTHTIHHFSKTTIQLNDTVIQHSMLAWEMGWVRNDLSHFARGCQLFWIK